MNENDEEHLEDFFDDNTEDLQDFLHIENEVYYQSQTSPSKPTGTVLNNASTKSVVALPTVSALPSSRTPSILQPLTTHHESMSKEAKIAGSQDQFPRKRPRPSCIPDLDTSLHSSAQAGSWLHNPGTKQEDSRAASYPGMAKHLRVPLCFSVKKVVAELATWDALQPNAGVKAMHSLTMEVFMAVQSVTSESGLKTIELRDWRSPSEAEFIVASHDAKEHNESQSLDLSTITSKDGAGNPQLVTGVITAIAKSPPNASSNGQKSRDIMDKYELKVLRLRNTTREEAEYWASTEQVIPSME
jgi:hypothetical protein